jgi:hypothetical protein
MPHLLATGLLLQTQWFMRAGARLLTANVGLDFLHDIFESCVISNRFPGHFACGQNWPPDIHDLNPCDYFLWGSLKERFFGKSHKQ